MARKAPARPPSTEVLADIATRFRGFPVPDRTVRLASLPARALRRYGLPPQPAPSAHPALLRAWKTAFDRDLELRSFVFDETTRRRIKDASFRIAARSARVFTVQASPDDTSENWAGAYLTANGNQKFSQVWGAWTVPEGLVVPVPPPIEVPGLPFVCSNWIGLDRQRRYFDSSLPQVGTTSQLSSDGTVTAQAWVQWWAREDTQSAPTILPLPVEPGDKVMAVLTAIDPEYVIAVICNFSSASPTGIAVKFTAPSVVVDGMVVIPKITGATAEWIVERPKVVGSPQVYNFPNYGTSEFGMCVAIECAAVEFDSLPSGTPQLLHGARLIRMLEAEADQPSRIRILSLAKRLSPESIQVAYGGFRV